MKHIKSHTLYENESQMDLGAELEHALFKTQTGRDLIAITKVSSRYFEKDRAWVYFSYVRRDNEMVFPFVESKYTGKNVEIGQPIPAITRKDIVWNWGYKASNIHTVKFREGGFSEVEDCLRALFVDLFVSF
jgi:hypothetical protein